MSTKAKLTREQRLLKFVPQEAELSKTLSETSITNKCKAVI